MKYKKLTMTSVKMITSVPRVYQNSLSGRICYSSLYMHRLKIKMKDKYSSG